MRRGMLHFKRGAATASMAAFDCAERLHPALTPYRWQRGRAYHDAGGFADGAQQFDKDVSVSLQ